MQKGNFSEIKARNAKLRKTAGIMKSLSNVLLKVNDSLSFLIPDGETTGSVGYFNYYYATAFIVDFLQKTDFMANIQEFSYGVKQINQKGNEISILLLENVLLSVEV